MKLRLFIFYIDNISQVIEEGPVVQVNRPDEDDLSLEDAVYGLIKVRIISRSHTSTRCKMFPHRMALFNSHVAYHDRVVAYFYQGPDPSSQPHARPRSRRYIEFRRWTSNPNDQRGEMGPSLR